MISVELVDQVVAALAEQLAPRVAAELAAASSPTSDAEAWRLLSLGEAARMLGRSERQVRNWAKSGELVVVRLDGGDLRFDPDDLREFARSRRVGVGVLADRWQPPRQPASLSRSPGGRPAGNRRVTS